MELDWLILVSVTIRYSLFEVHVLYLLSVFFTKVIFNFSETLFYGLEFSVIFHLSMYVNNVISINRAALILWYISYICDCCVLDVQHEH